MNSVQDTYNTPVEVMNIKQSVQYTKGQWNASLSISTVHV